MWELSPSVPCSTRSLGSLAAGAYETKVGADKAVDVAGIGAQTDQAKIAADQAAAEAAALPLASWAMRPHLRGRDVVWPIG